MAVEGELLRWCLTHSLRARQKPLVVVSQVNRALYTVGLLGDMRGAVDPLLLFALHVDILQ